MTARACPECLRRTQLLALLAGGIEIARSRRRPVRDVLALDDDALLEAVSGGKRAAVARALCRSRPADLLAVARERGLDALCRCDAGYPSRLRDDRSAPAVLFVLGRPGSAAQRLAELAGDGAHEPPAVAIVGTRRASPDGLEVARALGRGLAASGVTVVSGMALGIDSAAHVGALEGGGRSVAVLAGGADVPYPRQKTRLHQQLALSGVVVSEMPPGFRAFKWNFPARNRIIAGLAQATIVVEAAERSGSLITAELALDLGREVGAVPGPVLTWRARGTNALLRDGATLIRDTGDALDLALGVDGAARAARQAAGALIAPPADLAPELLALLAAVEDGRDTVGALSDDAAGAAEVRAGLMELELLGLIRRASGGRVLRVPAVGEL
jgi:DNA processing protein